jgi:hypothetical protein
MNPRETRLCDVGIRAWRRGNRLYKCQVCGNYKAAAEPPQPNSVKSHGQNHASLAIGGVLAALNDWHWSATGIEAQPGFDIEEKERLLEIGFE